MSFHDLNWKTWGIAFVVALGGTMELIKHLPSSKAWNKENLIAPAERPYAASRNRPSRVAMMQKNAPPAMLPPPVAKAPAPPPKYTPPPMSKEQLAALVAQQNKTMATGFEHEKKKEGEDEYEIVVDPKTGKKIKRKKKKKKKPEAKKEEKKEEKKAVEAPKQEEPADRADSDADIDAAISTSIVTGRLTPMPPPRPDDPFNGVEDWSRRLLTRPNLAETNRFIDHFRKNLVSPEVFYKVVTKMLEDSRPEMKKLGVLACANTPTYPMSFTLLAGVVGNQRNDASVKAKAEEALNAYTQYARLPILQKVLTSASNVTATIMAAVKVEESAKANLGAQQANAQPAAKERMVKAYNGLTPVLTNLSQKSPDARVKAQATQTLATLQSLLSSSTTAGQQLAQQPVQ